MPEKPVQLNKNVCDAMDVLFRELNNISSTARQDAAATILHKLRFEHRNLQQAFWSAIVRVLVDYATTPTDLRNEEAVKMAKVFAEVARSNNWDMGLPYI
jgi:hypothetical protein